ncbi:DUF5110 domain-containing protein [bacterium]|nr:DUF5110 domain-containing protein [bacterium]
MSGNLASHVDVSLATGGVLRVQPITPHLLRVRLCPEGRFDEPALVRYGILEHCTDRAAFSVSEEEQAVCVSTDGVQLTVSRADGSFVFSDSSGTVLTQTAQAPWSSAEEGFGAELLLREEERLYGLGDETRDRIAKRGHRTRMWVRNVASYVPIPYVMSTGGWALLVNSTWRHFFDLGHTKEDRLCLWGHRGELDLFLIAGKDLPALLDRYTHLVGRPAMLPLWGYGLTFVCNQQASAREMLDDALSFRREDIPCDLIGLEPGWMSRNYDYSVEKQWHPERFYTPPWSPHGPHTFGGALERLGFKLSLWLCCDYDLSFEEERQAGAALQEQEAEPTPARHPDDFEQDEHFGHPATYIDKLTRPEEPWFEHLKKYVDFGAAAFKLDGALQVNEHPDRKWGNGMDDEEMHNLYPVILNKQMSRGFAEHTGRRPMIYSSGGYTGIQRYSATWAGDTGGGPRPLVSMLNHGLSGHSNASCDMDVFTPEGIHFGFWMPWSQVCSWAYWRHPWLLGEKLESMFRFYARLRYRLLPYIYSIAHVAHRTGMPMMRAMPLAFPEEEGADEALGQYMFGDAFLTAAFAETIHLPAGNWIDFWTGERLRGPIDLPVEFPEDRGGPLYVRSGAIIPFGPEMDYVGHKPTATLELLVYPEGRSEFTLCEDDGVGFGYEQGEVAETRITCLAKGGKVEVTVDPRRGEYEGMPEGRDFRLRISVPAKPHHVEVNDVALPESASSEGGLGWWYDLGESQVRLHVEEDPHRTVPVTVQIVY